MRKSPGSFPSHGRFGATWSSAPITTVTPSPVASVDQSARDQRVTRGDLRPAMATTQQRQAAAQRAARLGEEGHAIAIREAKLEAKAEKKALAKKKAAAEKKRKAAAKRKAERARIKKLGYEPGTTNPRDIAKQIEQQLTYPGEIRVTVMRESRFVEYAR